MQRYQSGIRQPRRLPGGLFLVLWLAACSGGGGGDAAGGGGGNADSVSYTGLTSQAAVTPANADELSGGAVLGAGTGSSTSLVGTESQVTAAPVEARPVTTAAAIKRALDRMDETGSSILVGAMVTVSDSISGTCPWNPGSASFDIAADDVTGDFSGTIRFNAYCDDGVVLTGDAGFSGNIDPSADEFTVLNITTSSLTVASGVDSFTVAGSLSFTGITAASEDLSMTLNIRDGTGKVYRIENFLCALTYDSPSFGTDSVRFVSGRFYHPDHGYVDVVGFSDFQFNLASYYPYTGALVITGSSGSQARLTANIDSQTFQVEVDANGDNTYEDGPMVYRWDSL